MDLLGRKVLMEQGRGLQLLGQRIAATATRARSHAVLAAQARALEVAWQDVTSATAAAWASGDPSQALANSVPYLQAFGHTVLAWIWLDVVCAIHAADAQLSEAKNLGASSAGAYFYAYELPKIGAWLSVVNQRQMLCAQLPEAAF
jgi:butyryl-CoA dehydrogenase